MEITDHFNHYRVYDPNTNTYGEKFTWKQLLYFFYEQIKKGPKTYYWHQDCGNPFDYYEIETYFLKYGHTKNDTYDVEPNPAGHWEKETVWTWDETKGKDVQIIKSKYVRYPYIKKLRTRIVDSFGRTISTGHLKAEYKEYIRKGVNHADKKPVPIRTIRLGRWAIRYGRGVIKGYKFRHGPVPGFGSWSRKWCGRRYKGDHGNNGMEVRATLGFLADRKEYLEEYGVNIKFNIGRHRTTKSMHINWDERHHGGGKGVGWKRTRKEKQWMKGLRKLKP